MKKVDEKDLNNKEKDLKANDVDKNAALLEEFMQKNTKDIFTKEIDKDNVFSIKKIIEELQELKGEIEDKRNSFLNQNELIQEKLYKFTKSGKFKFDQDHYQKAQESIIKYEKLLEDIIKEVDIELNFCTSLVSEEPPKSIKVLNSSTDNFEKFLDEKLKSLKRYIKKIKKDLRVSFSKYNFSFDTQLRNLNYVEAYFKKLEKK